MQTIKVPHEGKGYKISYKVETIDINSTPPQFMNVYSVFIEDPALQKIVGDHYTILHNHSQNVVPSYTITSSDNIEEKNLKKAIWQQILNNPSE
jgi:hypothetical protein